MNARRDPDLLIAAWLQDEAPNRAPERLLTASRDRIRMTHQRRAWWPARRFSEMNSALKLAIAAAAVVIVAVVGINLLPRSGVVGGPGPSPTSTPAQTPTPAPSSAVLPIGSLVPGTYLIDDPCCVGSQQLFLTVPAGWETIDTVFVFKNTQGGGEHFDLGVYASLIGGLHADPCRWHGSVVDPPVGTTVADLASALAAQAGTGASSPTDVTVGGYPAKKVELVIPKGIDIKSCDDGEYGRWFFGTDSSTKGPFTYGDGQHDTVYILDVDGTRQVIDVMYQPGTSAANLAELDQILASVRFEPRASTPSPSP